MAALGTAELLTVPDFLVGDLTTGHTGGVALGGVQIMAVPDFTTTGAYAMAGTTPPTTVTPPPTTGQIWPRGQRS